MMIIKSTKTVYETANYKCTNIWTGEVVYRQRLKKEEKESLDWSIVKFSKPKILVRVGKKLVKTNREFTRDEMKYRIYYHTKKSIKELADECGITTKDVRHLFDEALREFQDGSTEYKKLGRPVGSI